MTRSGSLLVSGLLLASPSPPVGGAEPSLRLWYEKPAAAWVEALPIGSGRLGAMVFGGPRAERLALNEDTLWSGGPRDWNNPDARSWLPKMRAAVLAGRYVEADALAKKMQGPYNQSYLPLGDLLVDFELAGEVEGYARARSTSIGRSPPRPSGRAGSRTRGRPSRASRTRWSSSGRARTAPARCRSPRG